MGKPTDPTPGDRRGHRRSRRSAPVLDVLYAAARGAAGRAHGLYGAVGAFLLFGLAAATLAAAGFALLAGGVAGGVTQPLDDAAVVWARSHRSAALDTLAIVGAALGSGTATWIVLGVGSAVLWWTRHRLSAALLWISLVGGRWLGFTLKETFDRPRPAPVGWDLRVFGTPIEFPTSPSFPSGHAVTSVVVFGTLAYLVVRLEATRRQRRLTLAVAAGLILLIGTSRVYLGVHYPSDVLAGFLAGFVWTSFSAFAIEVIRYAARGHPEVARGERDLDRGGAADPRGAGGRAGELGPPRGPSRSAGRD